MDSYAVAQDMAWANRTFKGDVQQLLDADFDSVKIVRNLQHLARSVDSWPIPRAAEIALRGCATLSLTLPPLYLPGVQYKRLTRPPHIPNPNPLHRITAAMIKPRASRPEWSTSRRLAKPFSSKTVTSKCQHPETAPGMLFPDPPPCHCSR